MKNVNLIHLKYVDDLSLAEAINLPEKLVHDPGRPQPDHFHAKTGHVLPISSSRVFEQLRRTEEYANKNDMKLNQKKTKFMVFNPCTSIDFVPEFSVAGRDIELVDEMRILGLIVRSDLSWESNTENMVTKANRKLWMIRRLSSLGADRGDLIDIYRTQVRIILELAVPAWQGKVTQVEKNNIERVQKSAFHIILGDQYLSYKSAQITLGLENLDMRRNQLCLNFGKKSEKHEKFKHWYKLNDLTAETRQEKFKYCNVKARLTRFKKSPISFLTNMLNDHYSKTK